MTKKKTSKTGDSTASNPATNTSIPVLKISAVCQTKIQITVLGKNVDVIPGNSYQFPDNAEVRAALKPFYSQNLIKIN